MQKEEIKDIVEAYFLEKEWPDCYFVDCNIVGNKIEVFIDKDGGISFGTCARTSRHLESILDETLVFGEKYTLEVSSPGVGSGLVIPRQYQNNVGRNIEVKDSEGNKIKGILKEADNNEILIEFEETIKEGKKKRKELKKVKIAYDQIVEAKIKISFK